jgi:hypothetical protein
LSFFFSSVAAIVKIAEISTTTTTNAEMESTIINASPSNLSTPFKKTRAEKNRLAERERRTKKKKANDEAFPAPAQIPPLNFERNEFDAHLFFCRNASSTVESKEQHRQKVISQVSFANRKGQVRLRERL